MYTRNPTGKRKHRVTRIKMTSKMTNTLLLGSKPNAFPYGENFVKNLSSVNESTSLVNPYRNEISKVRNMNSIKK